MFDWKIRAFEKRRQQAESIPSAWRLSPKPDDPTLNSSEFISKCSLLTPAEQALTSITDGRVLQQKLLTGAITCVEVATAFSKRAAIAQQLTGCCTEMFFDKALRRAAELDDVMKATGKPAGPLHGFPISFKDNFDVEGVDSTIGWVGKIGQSAERHCMAVDLLMRFGAIIYVKTNIPQSLMMSDSYNHVFKQSVNAFNRRLISGGSSGGEAALLGCRASLIGMGTDIGGSVRIPAVLQGLYGLCPTVGRIPNDPSGRTQKYIVLPVAGPLTTDLSSMELYMETLSDSEPWNVDPQLYPIPWRHELAMPPRRPLKLAFVFDDGVVKPQPPVERVVRELAAKLKSASHKVTEWDPSSHVQAYEMWLKAVLSDGGEDCRDLCQLADEPLVEGMLVGKPENLLTRNGRMELEEHKTAFLRSYLKRWMESGIDALIMPVLPWVGFTPKTWVKSKQWVGYTAFTNFLNYTALAIPVGFSSEIMDQPSKEWRNHVPRNESDEFNHKQYDIELVKNMPVGVQIITGRFGEEKAIAVAKVIKELISSST